MENRVQYLRMPRRRSIECGLCVERIKRVKESEKQTNKANSAYFHSTRLCDHRTELLSLYSKKRVPGALLVGIKEWLDI